MLGFPNIKDIFTIVYVLHKMILKRFRNLSLHFQILVIQVPARGGLRVESRFVDEKDTKESHEKIATDQSALIDAVARLRIARAQHRFATRSLASAKIEVLELLNQSIPTKLSLQLLA